MQPMQPRELAGIAFIGGGNMARALIAGLLRQAVPAQRIRVGEPLAEARAALQREFGVAASADNADAVRGADLVVLAVKPQQAGSALRGAARSPARAPAACCCRLPRACASRIWRALSAGHRRSCARCPTGRRCSAPASPGCMRRRRYRRAQRALAELVGAAAGRAVWLRTEAELDVVTALSGSGPAYFFLLAEQMAQAAQSLGLEHETAALLAAETLHGAGLLAHAAARHWPSSAPR